MLSSLEKKVNVPNVENHGELRTPEKLTEVTGYFLSSMSSVGQLSCPLPEFSPTPPPFEKASETEEISIC